MGTSKRHDVLDQVLNSDLALSVVQSEGETVHLLRSQLLPSVLQHYTQVGDSNPSVLVSIKVLK